MKSILYIQINHDEIPELDLYQIFLKIYKESTSDKEVVIFRVNKVDDSNYIFSKIFRKVNTKNEDDRISIEKEEIEISQNDTIEKELEKYINKLQKKYEVYNLLSDLGQARLLGKYIDEIITIKKEELIFPL